MESHLSHRICRVSPLVMIIILMFVLCIMHFYKTMLMESRTGDFYYQKMLSIACIYYSMHLHNFVNG